MIATLLPARAPTWTPRLPAITVDCRAYLSDVVSSPNSISLARYDAAGDLSVISRAAHWDHWFALASMFDDIHEGAA